MKHQRKSPMNTYSIQLKKKAVGRKKPAVQVPNLWHQVLSAVLQYTAIVEEKSVKAIRVGWVFFKKYITIDASHPEYKKVKKIAVRTILCVIVLDVLLFMSIYNKIFAPISTAEGANIRTFYTSFMALPNTSTVQQLAVGVHAQEFLDTMTKAGFKTTVIDIIKKPGLTVTGNIVALGKDSLSVFEYADSQIAKAEATAIVNQYTDKISTNIFVKDNLKYESSKCKCIEKRIDTPI